MRKWVGVWVYEVDEVTSRHNQLEFLSKITGIVFRYRYRLIHRQIRYYVSIVFVCRYIDGYGYQLYNTAYMSLSMCCAFDAFSYCADHEITDSAMNSESIHLQVHSPL